MTEMFGQYEILEKLGEGGQGTVFRAMDTRLRREVAIKQSNRLASSDPAYAEAFQREARTAAGLNHANIVTVHETGVENDIPYIAMELLPHVLSSILESGEPLPVERVLAIGTQLCRGLSYAHERGVIHRDIKAHNILINDAGVAKITDFGIARATESSTRPESTSITGTVSYMPPERWRGQEVDRRADLYSLGILLYEMLTGTVPFRGELSSVMYQHLETPPPQFPEHLQIPQPIQAVVFRALEKDPSSRFASASEMLQALESARPPGEDLRPATQELESDTHDPEVAPEERPQLSSGGSGISFRNSGVINGTVRIIQNIASGSNPIIPITIALVTVIGIVGIVAMVVGRGDGVQTPASVAPVQVTDTPIPIPKEYGGRGDYLSIGAYQPKLLDKVVYTTQGQNWIITPREENFKIAAVKARAVNLTSTQVTLSVDENAVTLNAKDGAEFKPFEPGLRAVETTEEAPEDNVYGSHIWGPFQLFKGFEIAGWLFFEVPEGTEFADIVWDDVEFVRVSYPR